MSLLHRMPFKKIVQAIVDRWWYNRPYPNTVFHSIAYTGTTTRDDDNEQLFWVGNSGAGSSQRSFLQKINGPAGITTWQANVANSTNVSMAFFPSGSTAVANNGDILWYLGSSIIRIDGSGNKIWSANTRAGQTHLLGTHDGYIRLSNHINTSNLVVSKWSTNGTTCDWYFASTGLAFTGGRLLFNSDRSRVIYIGGWTNQSQPMTQCLYAANGVHIWGYKTTGVTYGSMYTYSNRTDNANAFAVAFSAYRRDFAKYTDGGAALTENWRKAVPSGNVINYITNDFGGNVFVSMFDGVNSIVSKVWSNGTISWSRKFRNARTHQTSNWMSVLGMHPTNTNSIYYLVLTQGYDFDSTKNKWFPTGNNEIHMLRVPQDGSKTGTYANLIYESMTAVTLTAQTAFGLTTNARTNTSITGFTANTVANTLYLLPNTSQHINGTNIA